MRSLLDAMNQCLSNKIRYYSAPGSRTYTGTVAYNQGVLSYDPSFLRKQSNYTQVFLLARSLAQSVLDQREQIYSVKKSPADLTLEQDTLVGFLTRCAYDRRYVSGDPRREFASFLSQSGKAPENDGQCEFFAHFNMPQIPYTIAMD